MSVFPSEMEAIEVSPEMLTLVGRGNLPQRHWPIRAVAFVFDDQLRATYLARPTRGALSRRVAGSRLIMLIDRAACERLYDGHLDLEDDAIYVLPSKLRAIAVAIRDCDMPAASAVPYRLAKSIEFVCEILRIQKGTGLVNGLCASLSFADYGRISAARRLIDEHWEERLTLASIARRCGINRSKLSRGFRDLYRCTVSEALSERRLSEARQQLITTDLPVGLIGYRSGYQNNASFSRAFCRRFGASPSNFRNQAVVA